MENFKRYAVYYAPRAGAFADRASAWLGWDAAACAPVAQPDLALPDEITRPIEALTKAPRKYGFHGTIRAPFRPAEGLDRAAVEAAVAVLAARLPPVTCDGLLLENLQGFLALTPEGCEAALLELELVGEVGRLLLQSGALCRPGRLRAQWRSWRVTL